MPVHVEKMTSEVAVAAGDLPLSEAQIEQLVRLVARRLEERKQDRRLADDLMRIRGSALHAGPAGY